MTFPKAQQEFQIRYYLWAVSEWENEIEELCPNLQLFKSGSVWKLHQLIKKFDKDKQLIVAQSLLKRFHPEAIKALGETLSVEEQSLRNRLDEFRRTPAGLDVVIDARRRAGEKIKFVGKRKLLNLTAQRFLDAFSSQCEESARVMEGDPRLEFQMKCSGWTVFTYFWFGRRESLINYGHTIASETSFEHQGPQGTYRANLVIGSMMSFCSWLGISSQTQWEYLMPEDVEQACDAAIKFCGRFFQVAPKLLKGLEFDKITSE